MAAIRTLQYEFDVPLIVYAENLAYSTFDYGYTKRDLPALGESDEHPAAFELLQLRRRIWSYR